MKAGIGSFVPVRTFVVVVVVLFCTVAVIKSLQNAVILAVKRLVVLCDGGLFERKPMSCYSTKPCK